MSFDENTSMFDVEMDYEEIIEIPDDYLKVKLGDMSNGEVFVGAPQISGVITSEFDDGFDANGNILTKTVHKIRLVITNEDREQYLDININLKSPDLNVKAVRKGSVLFDFIQSILELENPGRTEGKNVFKNINLQQFIDFIKGLKIIGVKNVERKGSYNFNSFYVVQVNNRKA